MAHEVELEQIRVKYTPDLAAVTEMGTIKELQEKM
jgi:hypothetical protein